MNIYVVQRSSTANGQAMGAYQDINRAREEADVDARVAFGQVTQTISNELSPELRVHLIDGKPVGSHAIYTFTLDEAVDHPELPEIEPRPRRRISLNEDV
jgi:hypothetical protein